MNGEWYLNIKDFYLIILEKEGKYNWQWFMDSYDVPYLEVHEADTFWQAVEDSHSNYPDADEIKKSE